MRWIVGYQHEMPFNEFKEAIKPPKDEPNEIILERVNGYLETFQRGYREVTLDGNI